MPESSAIVSQHQLEDQIAHLEAELAAVRGELEHCSRLASLGVLAAGIAHEINNILTPVLAYAQLASSNARDQQLQTKAITKAIHGVQMATQITQAMLGFASASAQGETADILESIHAAMDTIGRDPAKDGIDVQIGVHREATVRMRPLALQQVLMNLILNARTAMKKKGGRLTINASERGDGTTVIDVADTGPGIPKQVAGRLFEPFVSAPGVAGRITDGTRSAGGTGLGLSICRRLVEEAGGTIAASSISSRGTTFTITLPTGRSARARAV